MALTRVKTWVADEVLTADDLNAEFNNILNNAISLISPVTSNLDMDGKELILDSDADTSFTADTDDKLDLRMLGKDQFQWDGTSTNEGNFIAVDTDTGAAAGPIWTQYRNATGATGDVLGRFLWQGKDDGGTKTDFSQIEIELTDASAGSEDSAFNIWNTIAGTLTEQWHIGAGIYAEGNTDPGAGKIDADDLLISGNTVQPMTTQGDIIRGGASGVPERLAAGTAGQFLTHDATDASWAALTAASDTVAGVIEYAIQSEQETGTSNVLAVTPGRQHFHQSAVKFWAQFDEAANEDATYNVASINDDGVGFWTITIATDFSSGNYCAVGMGHHTSNTSMLAMSVDADTDPAAGVITVSCQSNAGSRGDPETDGTSFLNVAGLGDL